MLVEFARGVDAQVARLVRGVGRELADLLDGVLDEGQVVVQMLVFGREADALARLGTSAWLSQVPTTGRCPALKAMYSSRSMAS